MILNVGRLLIFVVDEVPSKTAGSNNNSKNKKTPIAQQEQAGSTICFSCLTQEIRDKQKRNNANKKQTPGKNKRTNSNPMMKHSYPLNNNYRMTVRIISSSWTSTFFTLWTDHFPTFQAFTSETHANNNMAMVAEVCATQLTIVTSDLRGLVELIMCGATCVFLEPKWPLVVEACFTHKEGQTFKIEVSWDLYR